MVQEKGIVILYTGEGKGKTTAALGLALRAAGYDKKILIIQFGKSKFSGELKSLERFGSQIKIIQGGVGLVGILGDKKSLTEHKTAAKKTFDKLSKELVSNKWDVVIADEIIGACKFGLITVSDILSIISAKPDNIDLILTGHYADKKIIERADLVTEMKMVKHPYQRGLSAKIGIDY